MWEGGPSGRGYVYVKLILLDVQYYKATITQLKKKILTMTLNKSHLMMNKINTMINITLGLG